MPRRHSRKVTRRLSKLRGDHRAMRGDLDRLRLEVVAQRARQRQAILLLAIATLVAAIVLAISIALLNHPEGHRARWALPGALYAVAVFFALVGLVWIWRSDHASHRLQITVALTAAATLALSAGLTVESDLILRTGPRGEEGRRGHEGKRGPRGYEGERGLPGHGGERGPRGERGRTGKRGPRGHEGKHGLRGERGPPGYSNGGS
jgi:hypothetical protein